MPHTPGADLVARAWLESLAALSSAGVATSLPATDSWTGDTFVTVTVLSGPIDPYVPIRNAVVQVDVWAKPGNRMPPWGKASVLVESIRDASYTSEGFGTLDMPVGDFKSVNFKSVVPLVEPHRVDDPVLARYSMDMEFTYQVLAS